MSDFARDAETALRAAAHTLSDAGIVPEALADFVPPRRVLLVRRPATMAPRGEVWRLGTLLVGAGSLEGTLFAARHATRAAVRLHPGNQSISREERRDIAAAALRGGYAEGTPVNYDATPIPLTLLDHHGDIDPALPIGVADGPEGPAVRVRWRAGADLAGAPTLTAYLAERVSLLVDPPQRSS